MTERYVAYLAGIGERDITRLGAQCGFWERVTRQLDRLSNRISAEDRKRVERVLQERVPHAPTRIRAGDTPRRELAALMDRASVAHGA
jgi:hypothetical protein